jgi:hypothetical protein
MENKEEKSLNENEQEVSPLKERLGKEDALKIFLPYRIIELVNLKHTGFVVVVMGADDPCDLERREVLDFAKEQAKSKLKSSCDFINVSDVIVNGQNALPLRLFTFRKKQKYDY